MLESTRLYGELQALQAALCLIGSPVKPGQVRTSAACAEGAEKLLTHIKGAQRAVGTSTLKPHLLQETSVLLSNIRRHAEDLIHAVNAGSTTTEPTAAADEGVIEQCDDLRDKCCYPVMDVLGRIATAMKAAPPPADAITPELATRLFCVTRADLREAVNAGTIQPYLCGDESNGRRRRFSRAQLGRFYPRRDQGGAAPSGGVNRACD